MKDIHKVQDLVEQALVDKPITRNSDIELYLAVCEKMNREILEYSFGRVLRNMKALGLPNPFSVSRARRKLQEKHPNLRAVQAVKDERYENWKIARAYANE